MSSALVRTPPPSWVVFWRSSLVALAGIGTVVVLFAVLQETERGAHALGLVASRTLDAATIFVGVAFLLSIVTLRKAGVGSGGLITSHALVALA